MSETEITNVQVFPLKREHKTIKANGSFTINDAFKIKFTIMSGSKGLFVGFPGKYGEKVDPETNKKPWYSDVICIKEEVKTELTATILKAYNNKTSNNLNQGEAEGPNNQETHSNIPY